MYLIHLERERKKQSDSNMNQFYCKKNKIQSQTYKSVLRHSSLNMIYENTKSNDTHKSVAVFEFMPFKFHIYAHILASFFG